MFIKFLNRLFEGRFWALVIKEINQILRNQELISLLIFPPTLQLVILGLALNPNVQNIPMGIVDYSNTPASRELISAFTENRVFNAEHYSNSVQPLSKQVQQGQVTAGLVIPPYFNRDLNQDDKSAEVQVLINAVDANTAGIAGGYITQIVSEYSRQLDPNQAPALVETQVNYLYNPGLTSSWFFVPGVLGIVVTLISTLVSAATVVREKDTGTLEQLLMTPAANWEILLAKIVPLFVLVIGDAVLALTVGRVVFGMPVRGSFLLFLALSGLYALVGIGIGIMLGTISRTQQQAQLVSFFVTLPVIQFSGAISPIESIPLVLQYLSLLNPLNHYVIILRGLLLKGAGLDVLWPNALALLIFAIVLLTISINRFRSQLS